MLHMCQFKVLFLSNALLIIVFFMSAAFAECQMSAAVLISVGRQYQRVLHTVDVQYIDRLTLFMQHFAQAAVISQRVTYSFTLSGRFSEATGTFLSDTI